MTPTRESLNASNRAAAPGTFRGAQPQHFFGTNRPATSPQSFDRQAAQVQQSIQRDGHFTPIRSGESANGRNLPANVQAGNNPAARGSDRSSERGPERIQNPDRGTFSPRETPANQSGRPSDPRASGAEQQGWHRFGGAVGGPTGGPTANRGGTTVPRNLPMNRGGGQQPDSRGTIHDLPARTGGGGWQRFPSNANRGGEPVDRGSARNGRFEAPSNNGNGGWNRGPRPEPSNSGNGNNGVRNNDVRNNDRYSNGGGGWDRGSRPEAPRQGSPDRGSAPRGDYGRGASRPTLDMRQPVVTPRSSGPSYEPRGGGRSEAPRPSGGGGGRSEAPRPSSGGGGHGGARPSGGGERHR